VRKGELATEEGIRLQVIPIEKEGRKSWAYFLGPKKRVQKYMLGLLELF